MKNLIKLYEKNMRDAFYANPKKIINRKEVFYKSMREYMVLKRMES